MSQLDASTAHVGITPPCGLPRAGPLVTRGRGESMTRCGTGVSAR